MKPSSAPSRCWPWGVRPTRQCAGPLPTATGACLYMPSSPRCPQGLGETWVARRWWSTVTSLPCERAYADGRRAVQAFLTAGHLSDLTVTRVPVVLGDGIPLFGPVPDLVQAQLVSSRAADQGAVQSGYRFATSRCRGPRSSVTRRSLPRFFTSCRGSAPSASLSLQPGSRQACHPRPWCNGSGRSVRSCSPQTDGPSSAGSAAWTQCRKGSALDRLVAGMVYSVDLGTTPDEMANSVSLL